MEKRGGCIMSLISHLRNISEDVDRHQREREDRYRENGRDDIADAMHDHPENVRRRENLEYIREADEQEKEERRRKNSD